MVREGLAVGRWFAFQDTVYGVSFVEQIVGRSKIDTSRFRIHAPIPMEPTYAYAA